jgi:hypothetical protein
MSIYEDLKPISLDAVKTYPLASRPSKVTVKDFAKPITEDSSLRDYLASLPNILAVQSVRELAARIRRAKSLNKPIIWGIGGHVIKTGLAPIIIDLMNRGFVNAIAGNGSVLVHDAEIAMAGSTSEDVDATLGEGVFGGAEETGKLLNDAARNGGNEKHWPGRSRGLCTPGAQARARSRFALVGELPSAGAIHDSSDHRRRHRAFPSRY